MHLTELLLLQKCKINNFNIKKIINYLNFYFSKRAVSVDIALFIILPQQLFSKYSVFREMKLRKECNLLEMSIG